MHSGVANVISDDLFNLIQKKATKRGRKPKPSSSSDFCRNLCVSSFAIWMGNLDKVSYISAENLLQSCYMVWHSSTTKSVTWHNCLAENLRSITCFAIFLIEKVFCLPRKTSLYFASSISRSTLSFGDKMMEFWALPVPSDIQFVLSWSSWVALKQWEQQRSHHLPFFCCFVKLMYQILLKAGQQNCNKILRFKQMNSSPFLYIF